MAPPLATPTADSLWRIETHIARVATDELSMEIDLARPQAGCHNVHFRGQPLAFDRWLAVAPALQSAPIAIEDSFTRLGDLVVTYAETPGWPIRWQVYWRLLAGESLGPALAGIELIVSAQTSLLDSLPALRVESVVAGTHKAVHQGTTVRAGLPGTDFAYLQMIHPADNQKTEIDQSPDHLTIGCPLFLRSLEKGVILRARLRGLIIEQSNAEATAHTCASLFQDSPTPLTV
jgi:hypothetical protein